MTDTQALVRFDAFAAKLKATERERVTAMLEDHGATEEEINETLAWTMADLERGLADARAEALRMLSDPDAPTGRLQ